MIRFILILFILESLVLYDASGQKEWAPIGAKWYMNSVVNNGFNEPALKDYYVVESLKDTVVNGLNCRHVGNYIMHQDENKIYFLHQDTLRLIYSFDLELNDTVTFSMLDCSASIINLPYLVDKIDFIKMDEDTLKRVTCKTLTENYLPPETYEYIEKIGSLRTVVEDMANCYFIPEITPEWLRCYMDDVIFYKTPYFSEFGELDCDYKAPTVISENTTTKEILIYPNPFHDKITIMGEDLTGELYIRGITGSVCFTTHICNTIELSLESFEKSIYLLEFVTDDNKLFLKKVIKL